MLIVIPITSHQTPRLSRSLLRFALALFLMASPLFGQQSYVSRYNVYAGYTFLNSPRVGLFENGFHTQIGVNPKTWYALGFDYSVSEGNLTLTPDQLTTALQQQLGAELMQLAQAGLLPAGYNLAIATHSVTQTVAGGPQLSYRHFAKLTLFVRPSIGGIHEVATPNPPATDPIAKAIVAQLAPTGKKTDWTPFYGFGGGGDIIISKHFALRVQADLVYNHLFNDLLKDGRLTTRFSVGPCFSFGKNIKK